jgi:rare lipoprotein A (peptidoglycan hydrolase)
MGDGKGYSGAGGGDGVPKRKRLVTTRHLWHGDALVLKSMIGLMLFGLVSCAKEPTHTLRGIGSWYGEPHHGRLTASGARFDMYDFTAAHRTLPMGTRVRVTNLSNGRSAVVTVNDRGPSIRGRVVDLSYAAARRVGLIGPGTAPVQLEVLD